MNFTSRSVKPDLKPENEDFLFETETPRGHFFALLDFSEHDFVNLYSTLETKLETIVSSFVTLENFSPDLLLGFLAKEINKFLKNLAEQAGDFKLNCSAALCLISGERLFHFSCGDMRLVLFNRNRTFELNDSDNSEQYLGDSDGANSFASKVQQFTLKDEDLLLIMTGGLASGLGKDVLVNQLLAADSIDTSTVCDSLMEFSENSQEDRTLVVIGGPYERSVETAVLDESIDCVQSPNPTTEDEAFLNTSGDEPQLEEIKERLVQIDMVLAHKADSADLLGLKGEVLKLGVLARSHTLEVNSDGNEEPLGTPSAAVWAAGSPWPRVLMLSALVLLVGTVAGYFGGWAQASRTQKPLEKWSVKSSGSQILLSRLNESGPASSVLIPTGQPVKGTGEQTFSTFTDAKHYIDTVTPSLPLVPVEPVVAETVAPVSSKMIATAPRQLAAPKKPALAATSVRFQPGDSLQKLAQRHNVSTAQLIALNPGIDKWSQVIPGQHVTVRLSSAKNAKAIAQLQKSAEIKTAGKEATVVAGETLDKLASRLKLTPSRLKQLNPKITNWSRIQAGQKVVVSNSARS